MGKKLITPPFTANFVNVFKPGKNMDENDVRVRYGLTASFKPANFGPEDKKRWKAMKDAAAAFFLAEFKKPMDKAPNTFKKAFRDGMEKEGMPGFGPGTEFLTLITSVKPQVLDSDGVTVITAADAEKIYAGCLCRASVNLYSFTEGAKGIAFGLSNLKKIRDGERIDGRTDAAQDFEDLGEEDLSGGEDDLD